jgi:hypothetical protein
MQQMFVTTNFLDAPDNKQEEDDRKDDGLDNASIKAPNLLATIDDEQDKTAPILKKTPPPLEPSCKSWRPRTRCHLVEQGKEEGMVRSLHFLQGVSCVWAQYGKPARDNDEVLNLMIGSHNQPPSSVHRKRKRAFVHVATLLFAKMGLLGHLKDMPACVVCGVHENWFTPNGVYSTDGVE